MLDYYKNLAPKILCNIRNGKSKEMNNKNINAYIVTVKSPSNKTIHELTLNIQSSQTVLKSKDATITKGLKFDSSIKDNILEVHIPFLSKGDEFSVTVYVENQNAVHNKPVLVIRSPEKFKEIDSTKQKESRSLWLNAPEKINQAMFKKAQKKPIKGYEMSKTVGAENKKPSNNKKAIMITVSILLVMITGVLVKSYFIGTASNSPTPVVKTIVPKQSTGTTGSSSGTTGVTSEKRSTKGSTGTTGVKKSTGETTGTTGPTGTTETTGSKATTGTTGTTGTAGSKATTGTTGSKATTETTGTTDSKTTTGTTGNAGTTGTTGTTGTKDK